MEPLALALAAVGALGASALPSLLVRRRRATALLERLRALPGIAPRQEGARVRMDALTSFGAVRVEVAPGVLGNRWRLSLPLAGYAPDESLSLYPRLDHRALETFTGTSFGNPKSGLPRLTPKLTRPELSRALTTALPDLARGSHPVLSREEAAWLVRLLLHRAADRSLAEEVMRALEGFHITPKALESGFELVLEHMRGETKLHGLSYALELRFALSRVGEAGWTLSSCAITSRALTLVADDRGIAPAEELTRRLDTFAALARLLSDARGSQERFPCPQCRMVFLEPPAGALSERECKTCRGRLLDREALRQVVLDPLGKSPGELREEASSSHDEHGAICPSCARAMRPVSLDEEEGIVAALCVGCGATWLKAGELERLSRGRYRG